MSFNLQAAAALSAVVMGGPCTVNSDRADIYCNAAIAVLHGTEQSKEGWLLAVGVPGWTRGAEGGGAVFIYSAPLLAPVDKIVGPKGNRGFGGSLASGGDLDGDGVAELFVASDISIDAESPGIVHALSGRDWHVIYDIPGIAPGDRYGYCITRMPDIDGDGVHDVAVGAAGQSKEVLLKRAKRETGRSRGSTPVNERIVPGYVELRSGVNGGLLQRKYGLSIPDALMADSKNDLFGVSICVIDDVDDDGLCDYLVSAPRRANEGRVVGAIVAISSATGRELYTVYGEEDYEEFGWHAIRIEDVDGDRVRDLLVGTRFGRAVVCSGASGKIVRIHQVERGWREGFGGGALLSTGDVDGDGVGDYLVGYDQAIMNPSYEAPIVFSGDNGRDLFRLDCGIDRTRMMACPDTDLLGHEDLIVPDCRTRHLILVSFECMSEVGRIPLPSNSW